MKKLLSAACRYDVITATNFLRIGLYLLKVIPIKASNIILRRIEKNPVIAAIRNEKDIDAAVTSEVTTVFLLHADIFNIKGLVGRIKDSGKSALIHMDFLEGLGKDQKALDYISEVIRPDGIISTRSAHIKYARGKGVFAVQRFFLIDSLAYETTLKTVQAFQPDMIEIMPGVMPSVIRRICGELRIPVIAGGLIRSKEDIMDAVKAGAVGVSTGDPELWGM